ncbi:GTPase, partial [Stenotrophomonas indicatrix]|uniref:GTPase n=1 Tax=Stenotrophomonas indicatrix TaxID=2045451 RepID=UPI002FD88D4C
MDEQKQAVAVATASRTWWQRMLGRFKRDPQTAATAALQARLDDLRTRQAQERQQLEKEKAAADAALASAENELARRLRSLPLLVEHADGAIIGDGRPDFTRETQRYVFDNGGAPIVLLDVPGIEGGEAGVKAHIDRAVQTAHAVFYVTGKAARPQHGDKEDGTLEKIKRHLGPQTEVWAVFNKRVTAAMPLRKPAGLFATDADGIADLDTGLREALAGNYKGVLPVSASPAFLALADRLPPPEALAAAA